MKQVVLGLLILFANLHAVGGETNAFQIRDVAFTANCDRTEQRYVLMLPTDFKPRQSHDVLIALHGHGSDRWQFARDPRAECRAARDVAAEHHMIYISPDYRAKTSWMGPKAEADIVQILGDLKQQFNVSHVFLCGASMGGMACLTFTALHPKLVDGVASMNGLANLMNYTNFSDAIAASFGGSRSAIPEEYKKRSAAFWPERFTMPVGITASGKDDTVPPQSVLRLAETLKARNRDVLLIYRPELGHLTKYDDAKAIIEFVIRSTGERKSADENEDVKWRTADSDSSGQLGWDALRGHFRLSFTLDPPATNWGVIKGEPSRAASAEYRSGDYWLRITAKKTGEQTRLIEYELTRTNSRSFRILANHVECKTSYSGVYKIFTPGSFSQQHYAIDLPFHIADESRAAVNEPVVWMQQTDGRNTFTVGLLNQIPGTRIEGSTYDTANGGEAPGIANSYARIDLTRLLSNGPPVTIFRDALYVNANPNILWFNALEGYSTAVDEAREFKARPPGKWSFNPMWHSWYAYADKIDQATILDEARRAQPLGVTTIEIDAGWNIPRGQNYSFDNEGDYTFDPGRFPNPKSMVDELHAAGQRVILHVAPLLVGKNSKSWSQMKNCLLRVDGKPAFHLDPRLEKVRDYLLVSWENLLTHYDIDGLWYDFLEIPAQCDPPASGMKVVSPDVHVAYTQLMQELFDKALSLNSNAVIILRRPSANLNSKLYCTHVWPMDTPQDYNMNRRDVIYMKTFGPGVLTHACCTSWADSESDVNVARQMASIVLAGVPALSVNLAEQSASHNAIVEAWLAFYDRNKRDLVLGRLTPLLPTPPSAALRIESDNRAYFGFFEAVPGLIEITKPINTITLVNAFTKRTVTRLEGVKGHWHAQFYDQRWQPVSNAELKADANAGINLNFSAPTECSAIVLTKNE